MLALPDRRAHRRRADSRPGHCPPAARLSWLGSMRAKLDVAACLHETQLKPFLALDETIFTTASALQLNSLRHHKRPMGDGYHSYWAGPLSVHRRHLL